MSDVDMMDHAEIAALRAEIARLQATLDRVVGARGDLSVARFVISDHEAGLPVAQSTLSAAQRALGLPAIDSRKKTTRSDAPSKRHGTQPMPNIVITGAGGGIGRATARAFLDAGWSVALVGRRRETLEETAAGRAGALIVPFDVSDPAAVDAGFANIAAEWGRVDALFNNAGVNVGAGPIDEIAVEDWLTVCNINITGMFLCARAAFAQMRRQDPQGGRIINNGSISAHVPRWGSTPYTMSKHAVTG
jgi:hypothetical protein